MSKISNKILDGMAREGMWLEAPEIYDILPEQSKAELRKGCRAALLWLAQNITDGMEAAARTEIIVEYGFAGDIKDGIAAAIIEAAGGLARKDRRGALTPAATPASKRGPA